MVCHCIARKRNRGGGNREKVIEVFGDYWHNNARVEWHRTELGRLGIYKQFGFDCLILWQGELKGMSDEEIAEQIKGFDKRKLRRK